MLRRNIFILAIVNVMMLKMVDSVCLSSIQTPQEKQFLEDKKVVDSFINSIFNKCPANTNTWLTTLFPSADSGCLEDTDCNSDSVCCPMSLTLFENHKICQGIHF
jgi:hypothetical protein